MTETTPTPPTPFYKRWPALTRLGMIVGGVMVVITAIGAAGGASDTTPPPAAATTKTVVKEVAPQACIDALNSAEDFVHHTSALPDIAGKFIQEIPKAYAAGATGGSGDPIVAMIKRQNARLDHLNRNLSEIEDRYNAQASACRRTRQ